MAVGGRIFIRYGDPILSSKGDAIVGHWLEEGVVAKGPHVWEIFADGAPVTNSNFTTETARIDCVYASGANTVWRFGWPVPDYAEALRTARLGIGPVDPIKAAAAILARLPCLPEPEAKLVRYIKDHGWPESGRWG